MSDPQLEDGYIRIANALYRAIPKAGLSKREMQIVLVVMDKTYGYGKTKDDMTMTQLATGTDLKLPHVSATVRDLEAKGVITVEPGRYGKVIGLVKQFSKWKRDLPKRSPRKQPEVTETVMTETVSDVTETVISSDQNSHKRLPKRSFEVTETVNTKDNPKRQLQKTIPKDSCAAPTAPVWQAYSTAYQNRYGVLPTRNAKVNGQIAQFVQRVPAAEAPDIAAFYVTHNAGFYVRCGHAVGGLLNDAEKLRTEWATSTRITDTAARQSDQTQAQGDVWHKLIREAERNAS